MASGKPVALDPIISTRGPKGTLVDPSAIGAHDTLAASVAPSLGSPRSGPGSIGELDTIAGTTTIRTDPSFHATLSAGGTRGTVLPEVVLRDGSPLLTHSARERYKDVRILGQGGVGEVALAEDQDIGRQVAVKRLLPSATDEGGMLRFVEEVRVMGSLEHPNIVPVHDVGVDPSGRLYFVMKKVDGETLENIIEKLAAGDAVYHFRYPLDVRVTIFSSILRALQYAHDAGVIHRDIKPSNVMVGRFGEVVLMDWGIARRVSDQTAALVDRLARADGSTIDDVAAMGPGSSASTTVRQRFFQTRQGALLGTPAYMAPEQARGENDRLDVRTDLYSLCVLFHELLVLEHYLDDCKSLPELLTAVQERPLRGAFHFHREDQPRIAIELSNMVKKGLSKRPEDRYQSAAELLNELHKVETGTFPVTCPVTAMRRGTSGAMKSMNTAPVVWLLALTIVFGLIAFALFTIVRTIAM